MLDIRIEKTTSPKPMPSEDNPLIFGTIFTDHMFEMDYNEGKGWHNPRVVPFHELLLEPAAMVFHYGQEMFEGLKAYKSDEGKTLLFRPDKNAQRSNHTNERICIPTIPIEDYIQAIKAVVKIDDAWVPLKKGTSLYIRPFIIATENYIGVRPSTSYKFMIILSPVGAYYPEGLNPIKIWIEDKYVRAVKGSVGEAKTGANYVASMAAQKKAHAAGYSQVLWLDGIDHKYIEEVGAMNIFFKIKGIVVTPSLNGSILSGVTRDTCITLCKHWGLPIEERAISVDELKEAAGNGFLEEVWGSGTAAVISPVGALCIEGKLIQIGNGGIGELSQRLYDTVTGIQLGRMEDRFNWTVEVDKDM